MFYHTHWLAICPWIGVTITTPTAMTITPTNPILFSNPDLNPNPGWNIHQPNHVTMSIS